jgi:hypothetical protein
MKRFHYGRDEWQRVNRTFKNEIEPIVKTIENPRSIARVRRPLGNYLVIRLVSMTDYYFSNIVRRLVDERNLDTSRIIDKKSLEEVVKKGKYSAGQLVGTNYNYANYDDIQKVFSELIDLDFLGTIRELERTDPYKYVKRAISLDNNWREFKQMFDLRDDIAHEMKDTGLSQRKLVSLADNTMNFLDAASWICHQDFMKYENNSGRIISR